VKNRPEFASVKGAGVPFESRIRGCPHLPGEMRDVVFDTTTRALSRITPVVFGDELFQTSFPRTCWITHSLSREPAPLIAGLPLILGRSPQLASLNAVFHRKASIVFAVYDACGHRNCESGHNLSDENNSSAILAAIFAANVESQVYLIEIR